MRVRVRDKGKGIPRKFLADLFKPFASRRSTSDLDSGVGIGLPNSKALCEAAGGSINLHSTPGQGTKVELQFSLDNELTSASEQQGMPEGRPNREASLALTGQSLGSSRAQSSHSSRSSSQAG